MKIILNSTELSDLMPCTSNGLQEFTATLTIGITSRGDFSRFLDNSGCIDEDKLFSAILNTMPKEVDLSPAHS